MYWLAIERELTSLETLEEDLQPPVSASAVLEAMHALSSRSLVERGEHGAVFALQPAVLEYVTERLVTLVSQEILEGRPELLLTHVLVQGRAKDYIRSNQRRLLLQPMLDWLLSHIDATASLEKRLELLLQQLRSLPRAVQGYGEAMLPTCWSSSMGM